jgi:hypothetical protein
MYCSKCGAQNADSAAFCQKCGASINQKEPAQVSPPMSTTPQYQVSPKKKKGLSAGAIVAIVLGSIILLAIIVVGVSCTALLGAAASLSTPAPNATSGVASQSPGTVETLAPKSYDRQEGSGTLGDYHVSIIGATAAVTYDDKPAVVIEYEWTNNSDEARSFLGTFDCKVYQNGIECTSAIVDTDKYGIEYSDEYSDIKPGATFKFKKAYELKSKTDLIDVEVKVFSIFETDEMVFKQFVLK